MIACHDGSASGLKGLAVCLTYYCPAELTPPLYGTQFAHCQ